VSPRSEVWAQGVEQKGTQACYREWSSYLHLLYPQGTKEPEPQQEWCREPLGELESPPCLLSVSASSSSCDLSSGAGLGGSRLGGRICRWRYLEGLRVCGRDSYGSGVEKPGYTSWTGTGLIPPPGPRCPGSGARRVLVENILMEPPGTVLPIPASVTCGQLSCSP
jgi:hypothetical protein